MMPLLELVAEKSLDVTTHTHTLDGPPTQEYTKAHIRWYIGTGRGKTYIEVGGQTQKVSPHLLCISIDQFV